MRPDTEHIVKDLMADLNNQFPGGVYQKNKEKIIAVIEAMEIHHEYFEEKANRPYGQGEQIKHELAEKYNKSYDAIHDDIYRDK